MKLTTLEVYGKLKTTDFTQFEKPTTNKGGRGQLIETALGVKNSSELTDLVDGEIKSFTQGQTIAVTMVNHCLSEIIEDNVSFEESKVGQKMRQTIYVGFNKDNDYIGVDLHNEETHPELYTQLREDYEVICDIIRTRFDNGDELDTITGPHKLLQIRTKGVKNRVGQYTPLTFCGQVLKDKGMAFYLTGAFGKSLFM